jgi:hypothetical protein
MSKDIQKITEAYELVQEGPFSKAMATAAMAASLGLAHPAKARPAGNPEEPNPRGPGETEEVAKPHTPKEDNTRYDAERAYRKYINGAQLTTHEIIAISKDRDTAKDYAQSLLLLSKPIPEVIKKAIPKDIEQLHSYMKAAQQGG